MGAVGQGGNALPAVQKCGRADNGKIRFPLGIEFVHRIIHRDPRLVDLLFILAGGVERIHHTYPLHIRHFPFEQSVDISAGIATGTDQQ